MNYSKLFLVIVAGCIYTPSICDEVITLFLKPYPTIYPSGNELSTTNTLKEPGAIDRYRTHNILEKDPESGILATYAGYLHFSNRNGQLTFPRAHEKPIVYVLITTRITPNIIIENTIHHWELEEGTPAALYKFERKQDTLTKLLYWETSQEKLPTNKVIPLETIILFANPKYLYVPTGISITYEKPNYVLPTIYVKKGIKILSNTLYVLNIRQFFGKMGTMTKKQDTSYTTLVDPHPTY